MTKPANVSATALKKFLGKSGKTLKEIMVRFSITRRQAMRLVGNTEGIDRILDPLNTKKGVGRPAHRYCNE